MDKLHKPAQNSTHHRILQSLHINIKYLATESEEAVVSDKLEAVDEAGVGIAAFHLWEYHSRWRQVTRAQRSTLHLVILYQRLKCKHQYHHHVGLAQPSFTMCLYHSRQKGLLQPAGTDRQIWERHRNIDTIICCCDTPLKLRGPFKKFCKPICYTEKLFNIHHYNAHFSGIHVSLKQIWRHCNLWRHKAFYIGPSSQASTTDLSHSLFEKWAPQRIFLKFRKR